MFRMKHQNNICQGKSDKKGVFASLIVRLIGKSPANSRPTSPLRVHVQMRGAGTAPTCPAAASTTARGLASSPTSPTFSRELQP